MKITKEEIKNIIYEAIRDLDFRKFDDPNGKEGTIGTMDTAQAFGTQDEMENVLDLLYSLEVKYANNNKLKHAVLIEKASRAIRRGDLALADKLLVFMFKTGGRNRAVYHAISYVREKMGK